MFLYLVFYAPLASVHGALPFQIPSFLAEVPPLFLHFPWGAFQETSDERKDKREKRETSVTPPLLFVFP
jgi:hypothetical protein